MPRGSRHKSHKQHKHSSKDLKEHTESDDDEMNSRQRAETVVEFPRKVKEESVIAQGIRVSKDSESADAGKTKLQSISHQGKDLFAPGNDSISGEYFVSKRRKEKVDSVVSDRWNGGEDERGEGLISDAITLPDYRENEVKVEVKVDGFGSDLDFSVKEEKEPKSKISVDSTLSDTNTSVRPKSKPSKRHENSSEFGSERVPKSKEDVPIENEEVKKSSSGKVDSKRKMEKESSRKELHQYKDGKDKERCVERDTKILDVKRERSLDVITGMDFVVSEASRKQANQEERLLKRDLEITEWQLQDELRNPELEKELEKRIRRRRDGSGDKEKWQDSSRDGDDRHPSSRDDRDRVKNGRYKDERHRDGRYKDKHRDDVDRDNRYRDDKHREEWSSRDRTSDRCDSKYLKDENKPSESRHKKSKLLDSDRDGSSYADDRSTRSKDYRGRKRSSDDNEDCRDLKSQGSKEPRAEVATHVSSNRKMDNVADKGRSGSHISNNQQKCSPSSGTHVAKDQYWHSSKLAESAYKGSLSEERLRPGTGSASSREPASVFGVSEKGLDSLPMDKPKQKQDHLDELSTENGGGSQYEKSPRSDGQTSPAQVTEKSPPVTRDLQNLNKITLQRSLNAEVMGQMSSSSKDAREYISNEDRERDLPLGKPIGDEFSQPETLNSELVSVGLSSLDRTSQFPGSSSNLLPPPPPFRLGIDTPSVLGSSEDDPRVQAGDRKFYNQYKRGGDLSMGRGQGNAWKAAPNWPSPVTNGFIPFQHGHTPGGFHALVQQYPAPPLFGVRPPMELNPRAVSYHMHEGERFSGHGRPFGWRTPADDPCPPHVQAHLTFADESHIYGRSDWEQNRHLMGGRAWDMAPDPWKSQNGSANMDLPASQKEPDYPQRFLTDEAWAGQSGHRPRHERNRPERFPAESIEIKRSEDAPSAKSAGEAPRRNVRQKALEPAKMSNAIACFYLSKLDISKDLAGPELYKQCTGLLCLEEGMTGIGNQIPGMLSLESSTVDPEEDREIGGNSNYDLKASLFPKVTGDVFQRATALYWKQRDAMKAKMSTSTFGGSKPEQASPASEGERGTLQDTDSPSDNENRSGGSNCDDSADAVGHCGTVSGGVIFSDGSAAVEALWPESIGCRVNLSRIHNSPEHYSPESTH